MTQLFETDTTIPEIAGYARVALEQGIDVEPRGLIYAVPEALGDLRAGERVTVPLGKRNKRVAGYLVQRMEQCELAQTDVKAIIARDQHGLALTDDLIELALWMTNYYCCPLGMVFASMLPAAAKRGIGSITRTVVCLSSTNRQATDTEAIPTKLTKLQRVVFEAAAAAARAGEHLLEIRDLADRAGARTIAPVKQLVAKGVLETRHQTTVHAAGEPIGAPCPDASPTWTLNRSQAAAVKHLADSMKQGFSVHLLHGVTGSGKTEVYLRLIENVLQARHVGTKTPRWNQDTLRHKSNGGPAAIVLVPEIALTPQTVARFVDRFDLVAVLHSGLTNAQRHDQWQRIRRGEANIVVGARSAVFAPVPSLGVLVVDEEHEGSYKQDQLPRYHARDVAIKRAQLCRIPVVLGSATPSLESYYNATRATIHADATTPISSDNIQTLAPQLRRSRYSLLQLPERVAALKLPKVEIVDMAQERCNRYARTGKGGVHLLSLRLEAAMRRTFETGGQAILLLNRRGYANYIACPDQRCGWLMNCEHCDVMMVYHKARTLPTGGYLCCHHCGAEQMLPPQCPQCRTHKVTVFGLGTQRVEEELSRKFAETRLLRMDSDTMRTARNYDQCLTQFRDGQIDVLLGTQMIAKGLDFPNVRVVGVISADTALNLPDFRAAERTFQLITQVAGRAGRGDQPGLVIVQSFAPHDPAIVLASQHDYETFANREIDLRCQVGLPPATRMVRIVVRYRDPHQCSKHATRLATALTAHNDRLGGRVSLRGPAPCPIARIGGFHRQQIELIARPPQAAASIQKLMTSLRNARALRSDAHTAVDVDPVSLM